MNIWPQTVSTPRGCLVGWKIVTRLRNPMYYSGGGETYVVGHVRVARSGWGEEYTRNFGPFRTAKELAKRRRAKRWRDEPCLPGIHLCKTLESAKRWGVAHGWGQTKIIPVAYSPKSIVGTKGDDIVVVYRMKVLG